MADDGLQLDLYREEKEHERMKSFMRDKGWSTLICADPADIFEIVHDMDEVEDEDIIIAFIQELKP